MAELVTRLARASGLSTLLQQPKSTYLLCLSRSIRMFAYGATALFLALFLSKLGVSDARIGGFMTVTLLGDVAISFLLTLFADALGRRRTLVFGSAMMVFSGVVFATTENFWMLALASIVGVISPSGNEIGPFRAVEESAIAQLCPNKTDRADVFAWYNALASAGVAFGQLWCGWLVKTLETRGWQSVTAYKMLFAAYAGLGIMNTVLSLLLGEECELIKMKSDKHAPAAPAQAGVEMSGGSNEAREHLLRNDNNGEDIEASTRSAARKSDAVTPKPSRSGLITTISHLIPTITPASRQTVIRLCLLFTLDSFASGLVTTSWTSYYFNLKFAPLGPATLGGIFSTASIIAAISNLFAAALAKRIGLIQTMVFTHLPSAVFLALIPSTPVLGIATTFLLLRHSTSTMDAAPRQAFLSMAVLSSERTAVLGIVNVVKTFAQSAGPSVTGALAERGWFWIAFVAAGTLKASYDLGMLKMFVGFRPPEDEVVAH